MPNIPRRFWWMAACAVWLALLWKMSGSTPPAVPGPGLPHLDKVAHFTWFGLGGFCLAAALSSNGRSPRASVFAAVVLAAAAAGTIDEIRQSRTPGRNGNDPGDWAADLAGGAAGAALCLARRGGRTTPGPAGKTGGEDVSEADRAQDPQRALADDQRGKTWSEPA
jgi:VanZ family protein